MVIGNCALAKWPTKTKALKDISAIVLFIQITFREISKIMKDSTEIQITLENLQLNNGKSGK